MYFREAALADHFQHRIIFLEIDLNHIPEEGTRDALHETMVFEIKLGVFRSVRQMQQI